MKSGEISYAPEIGWLEVNLKNEAIEEMKKDETKRSPQHLLLHCALVLAKEGLL